MSSFDPATDGWRPMTTGPMPGGIGIPWAKRCPDGWRYGMLTTDAHANPRGTVHGGILMTFADQGLSLLAWEAADRGGTATIQLNTHFLDAVQPGEFVELRGEVIKVTRSMVFLRGTMSVGARDVLAADGVWRVFRPR